MLLPIIWEVRVVGVDEPNVPNRERIMLQANQAVDMSQFIMTAGFPSPPGSQMVYPVRDVLFWFGGIALNPGDWIALFTGAGTPEQHRDPATGKVIHFLYWGRQQTLFTGNLVPVLFRYGGILVGAPVPTLPARR